MLSCRILLETIPLWRFFPAPSPSSAALARDVIIAARPQAASAVLTQRLGRVYKLAERPLSASYTQAGIMAVSQVIAVSRIMSGQWHNSRPSKGDIFLASCCN